MPQFAISLDQLQPNARNAAAFHLAAESDRNHLTAWWVDSSGNQLGLDIPIEDRDVAMYETTDGSGGYAILPTVEPAIFETEIPEEAVYLRLFDGVSAQRFPLDSIRRSQSGSPRLLPVIGQQDASFKIYAVAEWFEDPAIFVEKLQELHEEWTANHQIFRLPLVRENFAIQPIFSPSSVANSLFGTEVPADPNDRRIFGNSRKVKRYLKRAGLDVTETTFAMVVVNNPDRRGAGGRAWQGSNSWSPFWTALGSSPNEKWHDIVLHEFGHACGLADEYDSNPCASNVACRLPEPHDAERNVSASSVCRDAKFPWNQMCSQNTENLFETLLPSNGTDVGAVLGARYSTTEYYRPSQGCLMRYTNMLLCPVCEEVIGRTILGMDLPT